MWLKLSKTSTLLTTVTVTVGAPGKLTLSCPTFLSGNFSSPLPQESLNCPAPLVDVLYMPKPPSSSLRMKRVLWQVVSSVWPSWFDGVVYWVYQSPMNYSEKGVTLKRVSQLEALRFWRSFWCAFPGLWGSISALSKRDLKVHQNRGASRHRAGMSGAEILKFIPTLSLSADDSTSILCLIPNPISSS